ncbi:LUC7 N-terminus domain-containing protein [Ditylenchus destructor]|uniref:LUC7 N-terminus domain-containing protein n=1 Tax=Ditylenchus destructor TaxID=166010 RepID=A0AAD4NC94_9BILA|nr:LUC7 N-terminus domain-containing protein [Ditylenchus destructor]
MTDMMREMIEQLMGASRAQEEGKKLPPYDHHSVCRAYLLDCCPREILTDTRLESFVYCRKMHEPAHKADYNREQAKRDHFYDIESFDALDECVRAVDYEVDKIKEKIKKDTEQMTDSQEYIKTQKIFELNEKIGSMLVEVETLGGQGMVKESMEVSKNVEELKRKKRELEAERCILVWWKFEKSMNNCERKLKREEWRGAMLRTKTDTSVEIVTIEMTTTDTAEILAEADLRVQNRHVTVRDRRRLASLEAAESEIAAVAENVVETVTETVQSFTDIRICYCITCAVDCPFFYFNKSFDT